MEPGQHRVVFQLEETYWWHVALRELAINCLTSRLPATAHPKVLDAGCGTGMLMQDLTQQGYRTVGVDLAWDAIELARTRKLPALVQGTVERLPFDDEVFDAVISLDVLYHTGVTDDRTAAQEIYRVLRPGGIVLLNLGAYEFLRGPHDRVAHTRHRYRAAELREKLEAIGFRIVKLTYRCSFLFPIALGWRILTRFAKKDRPQTDVRPLPSTLNAILTNIMRFENSVLLSGKTLPFGLSVFCLARREPQR